MTIVVAAASRLGGVVASDGRLFGPAKIESGKVTQPARVQNDEYDKTFSCCGDRVIGAVAGLQHFSSRPVQEHIADIVSSSSASDFNVEQLAELLETEICNRLQAVAPADVLFECRKLDLLLVGCVRGASASILTLRFVPEHGKIVARRGRIASRRKGFVWATYGDDLAQKDAQRALLPAPPTEVVLLPFLKSVGRKAVQAGIGSCGMHPLNPSERACGGEVFDRVVSCKG